MELSVTLSMEVDPEVWSRTSSSGPGAKSVRESVQGYVLRQIESSFAVQEGRITGVHLAESARVIRGRGVPRPTLDPSDLVDEAETGA